MLTGGSVGCKGDLGDTGGLQSRQFVPRALGESWTERCACSRKGTELEDGFIFHLKTASCSEEYTSRSAWDSHG